MKILSRISTLFVTIALVFSLVPAAYATDTTTTPPDVATTDMLVQIISERLNVPCDMMTMIELGIIPEDSYLWNSTPYACDIYNILLPIYGVYPYPAYYYPDILPREDHLSSGNSIESNIAAILTGLAKPSIWLNTTFLSKAQLLELVDRLETGNYKPLEAPTELPESIADTEWNYRSFGLRNLVLIARDQLPEAWYTDFLTQDWQLINELPAEYIETHKMPDLTLAGVTSYADKTIYFRTFCDDLDILAHEFTHFAAWRAGIPGDQLAECYEEGQANGLSMRSYGWTNAEEYFAVFMERWISSPKDREALTKQVPKTATLAQELTENYSALIQK